MCSAEGRCVEGSPNGYTPLPIFLSSYTIPYSLWLLAKQNCIRNRSCLRGVRPLEERQMMKQKIIHIDKCSDWTKTLVALPTWAMPKVFRWGRRLSTCSGFTDEFISVAYILPTPASYLGSKPQTLAMASPLLGLPVVTACSFSLCWFFFHSEYLALSFLYIPWRGFLI